MSLTIPERAVAIAAVILCDRVFAPHAITVCKKCPGFHEEDFGDQICMRDEIAENIREAVK